MRAIYSIDFILLVCYIYLMDICYHKDIYLYNNLEGFYKEQLNNNRRSDNSSALILSWLQYYKNNYFSDTFYDNTNDTFKKKIYREYALLKNIFFYKDNSSIEFCPQCQDIIFKTSIKSSSYNNTPLVNIIIPKKALELVKWKVIDRFYILPEQLKELDASISEEYLIVLKNLVILDNDLLYRRIKSSLRDFLDKLDHKKLLDRQDNILYKLSNIYSHANDDKRTDETKKIIDSTVDNSLNYIQTFLEKTLLENQIIFNNPIDFKYNKSLIQDKESYLDYLKETLEKSYLEIKSL